MTETVNNVYITNKQNYLNLRSNFIGGAKDPFTFTSSDIINTNIIDKKFTQYLDAKTKPQIPVFEWHNVPDDTIELVLVCHDPDAVGGTYIHWFIFEISPETTSTLDTFKMTVGKNGSGNNEYTGPHPPDDTPHRYYFTLYALKSHTEFNNFTIYKFDQIITELERAGIIDSKSIMGTFQKPSKFERPKSLKKSKKSKRSI